MSTIQERIEEDPKTRAKCLKAVRARIEEKSLRFPRNDDDFLARFLRSEHYDIDLINTKLENFSKWYVDGVANAEKEPITAVGARAILRKGLFYHMPGLDKRERSVLFNRPGKFDPNGDGVAPTLRAFVVVIERVLERQVSQLNGVTVILDASGVGMSNFNKEFQRNYMQMTQGCFPTRLGGLFILNPPLIFRAIYAMVKGLLSEKTKARMQIVSGEWQDYEPFTANYSRRKLPALIGGEHEIDYEEWTASLIEEEAEELVLEKDTTKKEVELGLEVEELGHLWIVVAVQPNGFGAALGLRPNDCLINVNKRNYADVVSNPTRPEPIAPVKGKVRMRISRCCKDVWGRPFEPPAK